MSAFKKNPRCSRLNHCVPSSDCTPVKWSKYFENQIEVNVKDNTFHVYSSGKGVPVLLLIHGGGYSALTWSLFVEEITKKVECQTFAVDLRGHGHTKTNDEETLSLDVLVEDIVNVVEVLVDKDVPPIVLIGHSLGGAIAVTAAKFIPNVVGLCVIDVVEGAAVEQLSSMQCVLHRRPSSFKSIEQAVHWNYKSGQTLNLDAARVSMPGQIKNLLTGQLAADECDEIQANQEFLNDKFNTEALAEQSSCFSILEENENEEETMENAVGKPPTQKLSDDLSLTTSRKSSGNLYTWRVDLSKTEPFWDGWFKGLSQNFLDVRVPKVLLLSNINKLDTALTVAQMQGKFQVMVLPGSGHAIHEDQPDCVADIIAEFLVKQKLAFFKNPVK